LACLLEADEVFISSSLKLVLGVGMIHHEGRRQRLRTGPVTSTFRKHFRKLAGVA
jgi:branched-subunit amino acid aminotransferase/4-amino-4-deoxychorismate lyase